VVKVGINLSSIAIALEEATKNANSSNPEDLAVKTSFSGTAALTSTRVTTLALSFKALANAVARGSIGGFLDDKTIANHLANIVA